MSERITDEDICSLLLVYSMDQDHPVARALRELKSRRAAAAPPAETRQSDILVYFDMDGVLADFDEAYDRLIGERKPDGDVYWDRVNALGTFFLDLKPMAGMRALWDTVPPQCRRILSSIPKRIDPAANQKRDWLKANLDIPDHHIYLVRGKKFKQSFAQRCHILVDDWMVNIEDWRAAGGIGIHFQTAEQATTDLREALSRACDPRLWRYRSG